MGPPSDASTNFASSVASFLPGYMMEMDVSFDMV